MSQRGDDTKTSTTVPGPRQDISPASPSPDPSQHSESESPGLLGVSVVHRASTPPEHTAQVCSDDQTQLAEVRPDTVTVQASEQPGQDVTVQQAHRPDVDTVRAQESEVASSDIASFQQSGQPLTDTATFQTGGQLSPDAVQVQQREADTDPRNTYPHGEAQVHSDTGDAYTQGEVEPNTNTGTFQHITSHSGLSPQPVPQGYPVVVFVSSSGTSWASQPGDYYQTGDYSPHVHGLHGGVSHESPLAAGFHPYSFIPELQQPLYQPPIQPLPHYPHPAPPVDYHGTHPYVVLGQGEVYQAAPVQQFHQGLPHPQQPDQQQQQQEQQHTQFLNPQTPHTHIQSVSSYQPVYSHYPQTTHIAPVHSFLQPDQQYFTTAYQHTPQPSVPVAVPSSEATNVSMVVSNLQSVHVQGDQYRMVHARHVDRPPLQHTVNTAPDAFPAAPVFVSQQGPQQEDPTGRPHGAYVGPEYRMHNVEQGDMQPEAQYALVHEQETSMVVEPRTSTLNPDSEVFLPRHTPLPPLQQQQFPHRTMQHVTGMDLFYREDLTHHVHLPLQRSLQPQGVHQQAKIPHHQHSTPQLQYQGPQQHQGFQQVESLSQFSHHQPPHQQHLGVQQVESLSQVSHHQSPHQQQQAQFSRQHNAAHEQERHTAKHQPGHAVTQVSHTGIHSVSNLASRTQASQPGRKQQYEGVRPPLPAAYLALNSATRTPKTSPILQSKPATTTKRPYTESMLPATKLSGVPAARTTTVLSPRTSSMTVSSTRTSTTPSVRHLTSTSPGKVSTPSRARTPDVPSPTNAHPLSPEHVQRLAMYGDRRLHDQLGPIRIPAVSMNEQKFVDGSCPGRYRVLSRPQDAAWRGQEALTRVCYALEQLLRARAERCVMITDYKFKECYLARAPGWQWPQELKEGTFNVLLIGPRIGIICIQRTCMDETTNQGTTKKQARVNLTQLEKVEEVVRALMRDLDLPAEAVLKVMALPNITMAALRSNMEQRTLKKLAGALGTREDSEEPTGILTLDCLPEIGTRHWPDRERQQRFAAWFDSVTRSSCRLREEVYQQIFARLTCGWSRTEVWTADKPRTEIRTLAHAVVECARRHRDPVLTPQMDRLLQSPARYVIVTGEPGCGSTFLMLVKARLALERGFFVVIFVPPAMTGLTKLYREDDELKDHADWVYFWDGEDQVDTGSRFHAFTSLNGEHPLTLDQIQQGERNSLAVFDHVAENSEMTRFALQEAPKVFTEVWAATGRPFNPLVHAATGTVYTTGGSMREGVNIESLDLEKAFHVEHLGVVIRLPTAIQALLHHGATDEPHSPTEHMYCDVSTDLGLATDGLDPVFIFHPRRPGERPRASPLECAICNERLNEELRELARLCSDKEVVGDSDLDENRGDVPPPLDPDDVIVVTEDDSNVDVLVGKLRHLGVWPEDEVERARQRVYSARDLSATRGTEKALVVYVGSLEAPRHALLRTVTRRLREAMSLCQGRLVVALDITIVVQPAAEDPRAPAPAPPYQLELEQALQAAEKNHQRPPI